MSISNVSMPCIAIRRHPKRGLRRFISTIARTSFGNWPSGFGFRLREDYLRED
jgi:hypothetical protein